MKSVDQSCVNGSVHCSDVTNEKKCKKGNNLEIAFSMILFIFAVCGVWQASSLAISFVSLMQ